jgi:hypothetical protein
MLGEPVRPFHVVGGGLVLLGVACAQALQRPLKLARLSARSRPAP